MPQFQNYYPNNQMMGNVPNYNTYNPMQDVYANRLNQMQQQIQTPQMANAGQMVGLNGKVVDDFSVITGNDVPMDNMGAIFVKSDGMEIQRRVWDATNGSIVTTSYKPVEAVKTNDGTPMPKIDLDGFMDEIRTFREYVSNRLDNLEELWTKSSTKTAKSSTRTKKEVSADE